MAEAEMAEAQMAELRAQLANTPAEVMIANHAYGLFELGALYLSFDPPQMDRARLSIDALTAVLEGVGSRLGDQEESLRDGLTQLRLAFVQIGAGAAAPAGGGEMGEGEGREPGEG